MIRVADLETMDRAALIAAWTELFGTPAPKGLSQAFLRRFLATEIQTRRLGGLPASGPEASLTRRRQRRRRPPAARRSSPAGGCCGNGTASPMSSRSPRTGYLWNGEHLALALGHRPRDHRRALVGPALLRPDRDGSGR